MRTSWKEEAAWAAWVTAGAVVMGAVMTDSVELTAQGVVISWVLWIALRILLAVGFWIAGVLQVRRDMRRLAQATPEEIQRALDHLVQLGYIERTDKPEAKK